MTRTCESVRVGDVFVVSGGVRHEVVRVWPSYKWAGAVEVSNGRGARVVLMPGVEYATAAVA